MFGNYCYPKKECPDGQFQGGNSCRDCSYANSAHSNTDECAKCDKTANPRVMFGNYCYPKKECPDGQFQVVNSCYACSYKSAVAPANAITCAECDTTDTPREILIDRGLASCGLKDCSEGEVQRNSGDCVDCSVEYGIDGITADECAKCDKTDTPREMFTGGDGSSYCALKCPDGQIHDDAGYCQDCSTTNSIWSISSDECAKCDKTDTPREMFTGGDGFSFCALKCPDGQLHDHEGNCMDCSFEYSIFTSATECTKCDTTSTPREMYTNEDDSYCALKCPDGLFHNEDGLCMDCSTMYKIRGITYDECAKCDTTATPREMIVTITGSYYCGLKCPDGQLHDHEGNCQDCSTTNSFWDISSDECAKCDKTTTPREMFTDGYGDSYCALKCPDGQIHDYEGICRDCSTTNSIWGISSDECAKCDKTTTPREISRDINGYFECLLPCPDGQIHNYEGYCVDCSMTDSIENITYDECAKCDKTHYPRKIDGDACVLK